MPRVRAQVQGVSRLVSLVTCAELSPWNNLVKIYGVQRQTRCAYIAKDSRVYQSMVGKKGKKRVTSSRGRCRLKTLPILHRPADEEHGLSDRHEVQNQVTVGRVNDRLNQCQAFLKSLSSFYYLFLPISSMSGESSQD